jgi:uncharacterized protein YbjT (DUF2867 family)
MDKLKMTNNENVESILVLGGTGHYGRHIVQSLIKKKIKVRVLSRNAEKAIKILGMNVEVMEGDITSKEVVINSLQGIRAVIISISAFNRKLIRKTNLIERDSVLMVFNEAKKQGIDRIVYISVYKKPPKNSDLCQARIKNEIEERLEKSDFNYTILGASPSIEIFFEMIRKNKMTVPGGGPPALPTISPIDLGEIAAQAVLRSDLNRKRFQLVGPEPISFKEASERISKSTGENITFRKVPLLPIRIASLITGSLSFIFPYFSQFLKFIILMNSFQLDIIEEALKDHKTLLNTFNYTPRTLEDHAMKWYKNK